MDNQMEIIVVTASREDDQGFGDTQLVESLSKMEWDWVNNPIYRTLCNYGGLPQLYNRIVTNEERRGKTAILVHDDVRIEDLFFVEKLEQAMGHYDIVGLAGTTEFDFNMGGLPISWYSRDRHGCGVLSGAVAHPQPDRRIAMSSYGLFQQDCIAIDGLFMAVNVGALLDAEVSFDERFRFNFYDLDFCLSAGNAGLRIGTWPIWVCHQSRGEGVASDEFAAEQELFLDKWVRQK